MKSYWTNKKNVIEMEIQAIKNEQQYGKNEKWEDVAKEFSDFTEKYWVKNDNQSNKNKLRYFLVYFYEKISHLLNLLDIEPYPIFFCIVPLFYI